MPNKYPYVQAAFACEKVLEETDHTFSVIRIVDTYWLSKRQPNEAIPAEASPAIGLTIFLSLKSGDVQGKHSITFQAFSPSARFLKAHSLELDFLGGVNGATAQLNITLVVEELGLYWCDVLWAADSFLLTRIPLRVLSREQDGSTSPTPEGRPTEQSAAPKRK